MAGVGRKKLSVTERQIRDGLAKVMTPLGVPLTQANALSEIAINDGKVYFSINVDATQAQAWAEVRAKAEAAVRAIPGVTVAMVVLTAERRAGSPAAPQPQARPQGVPNVASHRPHGRPGAGLPKQAEIPGVAAIIAVASGKGGVESPRPR